MDPLPDPLVAADVDLQDFAFMPLDVRRLRDSDTAALPDPEAFRAAVILWCVAWHNVPAASIPDDDATLCRLAGYGRDMKTWRKAREAGALRGFVKCSDGRLYHAVIAEKAIESWNKKQSYRSRMEQARVAKQQRNQHPSHRTNDAINHSVNDRDNDRPVADAEADSVSIHKGQGEGEGQGERESSLRSDTTRKKSEPNGTRLPEDWNPGPHGAAFAKNLGLHPETTFEKFQDYWRAQPGAKGRKLDWLGTWRNWCRSEAERRGTAPQPKTVTHQVTHMPGRLC